jgi:hypothetical protein
MTIEIIFATIRALAINLHLQQAAEPLAVS